MATKIIFLYNILYCSIRHEIIFHLICHMPYVWKSIKLVFFCIKKLQKKPKLYFW